MAVDTNAMNIVPTITIVHRWHDTAIDKIGSYA